MTLKRRRRSHRIEDLQQLLPLLGRELGREGDQVGQPARLLDAAHHRQHFFRHVRKHADVVLDLLQHGRHRRFGLGRGIDRIVVPDDARDDIGFLLHELVDDAAGNALQDDVAATTGPELPDLGDDTDAAQLVLLRFGLRIGDPLWVPFAVRLNCLRDGVGQQRPQLPLVGTTVRGKRAQFRRNRAFCEDEDEPIVATGGPLDDARRLLIFYWERNRHMGQQECLVNDEHWQHHRGWFATRALFGPSPTGSPGLGRG